MCRIYHSEFWGLRDNKYDYLCTHDFQTVKHIELNPSSPFYFFVPKEEKHKDRYESYLRITELFPINSVGIVTARDSFAIDFHLGTLKQRIRQFRNLALDDDFVAASFKLKDTSTFKLSAFRKRASKDDEWEKKFINILYRPFDYRKIYYSKDVVERQLFEVMQHMLQPNLALCIGRAGQVVGIDHDWNIVFCSDQIEDFNLFYRGGNVNFPLYLYKQKSKGSSGNRFSKVTYQAAFIFEPEEGYSIRKTNLNPKLMSSLKDTFERQPLPEDILYYIYAVLYSPSYRQKYAEFLKTDFPRVPFTKDFQLFRKLAAKGEQLVELHLLKSGKLDKPIAKCEGGGDLRVVKVSYDAKKSQVQINPDKYFAGVPADVWEYHIGGYQVAEKWLKDRRGRILSSEETAAYANIITAIAATISIQESLDDLFTKVELNLLEISI